MKTKEEIKKWLLKNCVNERGQIDFSDLDLGDNVIRITDINNKTLEFKDVFQDADLSDTVGMGGWHKLYERKE